MSPARLTMKMAIRALAVLGPPTTDVDVLRSALVGWAVLVAVAGTICAGEAQLSRRSGSTRDKRARIEAMAAKDRDECSAATQHVILLADEKRPARLRETSALRLALERCFRTQRSAHLEECMRYLTSKNFTQHQVITMVGQLRARSAKLVKAPDKWADLLVDRYDLPEHHALTQAVLGERKPTGTRVAGKKCNKCGCTEVYEESKQTRLGLDEGMTRFFTCAHCLRVWT